MATRRQKIIGAVVILAVIIWILDKVSKNIAQKRRAEEARKEPEDGPAPSGTTQYANFPTTDPQGGPQSSNEPAWYEDAWDWTVDTAEEAWDWTAETAEDAWDWTAETAEEAWDWTAETAEDFWDWATDW